MNSAKRRAKGLLSLREKGEFYFSDEEYYVLLWIVNFHSWFKVEFPSDWRGEDGDTPGLWREKYVSAREIDRFRRNVVKTVRQLEE